jgi:hypothetical protein
MGVQWVPVPDGVYDRGESRTNAREAERIAWTTYCRSGSARSPTSKPSTCSLHSPPMPGRGADD